MGIETRATVELTTGAFEAKALLETDEIVLRGDRRLRIPFAEITAITVEGDRLRLSTAEGPVALVLGAREAERWAGKIRNPPSRLAKLGIKMGTRVHVDGVADAGLRHEIESAGARHVRLDAAEIVLLGVDRPERLQAIADTAHRMAPAAHLWAIRPKGRDAAVSESEVMRAGLDAGLSLSKTVRFSDSATGERFSWPKR